MAFAVVQIGGLQYPVHEAERIVVPLRVGEPGAKVSFDSVRLLGEGAAVKVGRPVVAGATVEAEVLEHRKGAKVTVGKFKRKRDYHRKKGHRQDETVLRITRISA
ncbi:MAG TPA: 50S ribosomal protein L21 [Candidatus Saccharimonadales bacterium]|nr:50S ribosomal protein L21 [Candidatus Saccharimonadales bacterium]